MSKRRFGVEIECIGKQDSPGTKSLLIERLGQNRVNHGTNHLNRWTVKHDGSVCGSSNLRDKGYSYPIEITTPPMQIHNMGEIKTVLSKKEFEANSSCGLHVHVEALSFETVKNAVIIWKKFESQIIKAFPPSRHNNQHCRRCNRTSVDRLISRNASRYKMVNVQSWYYRGTIEFRGHAGTANYHKIKRWVLFCLALVEKASLFQNDPEALMAALRRRAIDVFDFLEIPRKTKNYFNGRSNHFEKLHKRAA